jgi:cell wall-associated NlpC family hydrolase
MPAVRIPVLSSLANRVSGLTGAAIASDAERWTGQGYTYGGTGARPGDWDCSSFVSYVLGHDLSLALPGGTWRQVTGNGTQHGPVVTDYASWTGATTVGTAQAGDLCCFVGTGTDGHIGIAVSGSEMVSALNSTQGTVRTPIVGYGPAGAPLIYRRVLGVKAGGTTPGPSAGSGGQAPVAGLVIALLAPLIVIGAAALGASLLAVGGAWVLRQAVSS